MRPYRWSALLLLCAATIPVAAQQTAVPAPPPPEPRELARQWEDVLLLDAIRHLYLSHSQLVRTRPLVDAAARRVEHLTEQKRRTGESLGKLLARHRARLLKGERNPGVEQEKALLLRDSMRAAEARAADEIVLSVTPRLARILLGEQASRAFLLARGDWPEGIDRGPALLHHDSGFVLHGADERTWREAALRQGLLGRYPKAVLERLPFVSNEARIAMSHHFRNFSRIEISALDAMVIDSEPQPRTPATEVEQMARQAQLTQARVDRDSLKADPERLAKAWSELVDEKELPDFLRRFSRRVLLSPRLRSVLSERLVKESGNDSTSKPALDQEWEDVVLLEAVRYLQFSPEQLKRLWSLADLCSRELTAIETRLAPGNRRLWDESGRFRESLVQGRPLPSREQQALLDLSNDLRKQRIQATERLAQEASIKLATLLDREQLARIYLLLQGGWPRAEAKSPMLLTDMGFHWEAQHGEELRDRAIRKTLDPNYPADVLEEVLGRSAPYQTIRFANALVDATDLRLAVVFFSGPKAERSGRNTGNLRSNVADPVREAAVQDLRALEDRWNNLGAELARGARPHEIEQSLRPLVRRLFLSPRFGSVLKERLDYPELPSDLPAPMSQK